MKNVRLGPVSVELGICSKFLTLKRPRNISLTFIYTETSHTVRLRFYLVLLGVED